MEEQPPNKKPLLDGIELGQAQEKKKDKGEVNVDIQDESKSLLSEEKKGLKAEGKESEKPAPSVSFHSLFM